MDKDPRRKAPASPWPKVWPYFVNLSHRTWKNDKDFRRNLVDSCIIQGLPAVRHVTSSPSRHSRRTTGPSLATAPFRGLGATPNFRVASAQDQPTRRLPPLSFQTLKAQRPVFATPWVARTPTSDAVRHGSARHMRRPPTGHQTFDWPGALHFAAHVSLIQASIPSVQDSPGRRLHVQIFKPPTLRPTFCRPLLSPDAANTPCL